MKILILFCFIYGLEMVTAGFLNSLLACHNEKRAIHGVPPMTLNTAVSNVAQKWANTLAREDRFDHNPNTDYGENLYGGGGDNPSPDKLDRRDACEDWYKEIEKYDFNDPGYSSETGHFTQLVWKDSTQLGGGFAFSSSGDYVVVANYNPGGNYDGEYEENVPKPHK